MPKQLKAFKYRIYPNKEQEIVLNKTFGSVRRMWNILVADFNRGTDFVGPTMRYASAGEIISATSWMKESISYGVHGKFKDFHDFKKQFFSKTRKSKVGRPSFKVKGRSNDSFNIPGQALKFNECCDFTTGTIKLTKVGKVKCVFSRKFDGLLRSVTVSKNKANQYFVSILVEVDIELKQNTGKHIGIDLGLKDLAILTNGVKIANPRWFRETQAKLRKAQKALSRREKGSVRWEKARLRVAKIHLKITRQREWFYHNLSSWILANFDTICMESLKVKNMIKNRKLAKSIQDASWSTLVSMIAYKSNWYGKTFHQIDTWFASSKTCSCCGHKMDTMELSVREWICPSCGVVHDRDLNAATNILNKGLDDLYGIKSEEMPDYNERGDAVRPTLVHPVLAASMKRLDC